MNIDQILDTCCTSLPDRRFAGGQSTNFVLVQRLMFMNKITQDECRWQEKAFKNRLSK
jgi:hypothetical protein